MQQRVLLRIGQVGWVVFSLLLIVNIALYSVQEARNKFHEAKANSLLIISEEIESAVESVIRGNLKAASILDERNAMYGHELSRLREKSDYILAEYAKADIDEKLRRMEGQWLNMQPSVKLLIKQSRNVEDHYKHLEALDAIIKNITKDVKELNTYENVSEQTKDRLQAIEQLSDRLRSSIQSAEDASINQFNVSFFSEVNSYQGYYDEITSGFISYASHLEIRRLLKSVSTNLSLVMRNMGALASEQSLIKDIDNAIDMINTNQLHEQSAQLLSAYTVHARDHWIGLDTALFFAILSILTGFISYHQSNRYLAHEIDQDEVLLAQDEDAIRQFIHEIENLEQGNFSVECQVIKGSVTEEMSEVMNRGLDQVRMIIQNARKKVVSYNESLNEIKQALGELKSVESAQKDAFQEMRNLLSVVGHPTQVKNGNKHIGQLADQTVKAAKDGVEKVEASEKGMHEVEEHLEQLESDAQRLGNQIAEINNCTDAVNDATEQTVILALNAAIQASLAGESGQGFSIVASEMQDLAEQIQGMMHEINEVQGRLCSTLAKTSANITQTKMIVLKDIEMVDNANASVHIVEDKTQSLHQMLNDAKSDTNHSSKVQALSIRIASITQWSEKLDLAIKQVQKGVDEAGAVSRDVERSLSIIATLDDEYGEK